VLDVRLARVNVEVECAIANALETRIVVRRSLSPPTLLLALLVLMFVLSAIYL
jgi:hypothetical protein